jgi:hypothetical protein
MPAVYDTVRIGIKGVASFLEAQPKYLASIRDVSYLF